MRGPETPTSHTSPSSHTPSSARGFANRKPFADKDAAPAQVTGRLTARPLARRGSERSPQAGVQGPCGRGQDAPPPAVRLR